MKLSDANRQKMHELISENGKTQKAIKEDATLTDEQRKEKLQAWKKDITVKEKTILTPEQFQIWRNFGKSLSNKIKN
jgi:Spy/CpxP family protein refolding chaperone